MRETRPDPIVLAGAAGAALVLLAGMHAGMNLAGVSFAWYVITTVLVAVATGLALVVRVRRHRAGLPPSAFRRIEILPDPTGCEPVPVRVVGRHAHAQRLRLTPHPRALRPSG